MITKKILQTTADPSVIILRLMAGVVFVSGGMQKFLFAGKAGAGRFARIGLPGPEFPGPLVGAFELVCGALVLLGLFTRLAAVPLLIIMRVAMATTWAAIFIIDGFGEMMHASRNDWAMLPGSLFLLLKGGGKWSVDRQMQTHEKK